MQILLYEQWAVRHRGRALRMQPVSAPSHSTKLWQMLSPLPQALLLLWKILWKTQSSGWAPPRLIRNTSSHKEARMEGSLQPEHQYSSRLQRAQDVSPTPCSGVHQQSNWPCWQEQQRCSHLPCHWPISRTTTNSEATTDWRVRDEEMKLHHHS